MVTAERSAFGHRRTTWRYPSSTVKAIDALYEPLIVRDLDAVPGAVERFRREHSSAALYSAIAQFATLVFNASQHGRHAFLATVAAHDILSLFPNDFDAIVTECARYAASSRLPWSEAPITDPPPLAGDQRKDIGEIREAVKTSDRLRAERWLAANLDEASLANDYFTVAADDLSDFGHSLTIAVAAWKLAQLFPIARYAVLRVALYEWTSPRSDEPRAKSRTASGDTLQNLLDALRASGGSIEIFQLLSLYASALEAEGIAPFAGVMSRVAPYIAAQIEPADDGEVPDVTLDAPRYTLARDCGEYLESFAVRETLRRHMPDRNFDEIVRCARWNREHGPSFEEWSFA